MTETQERLLGLLKEIDAICREEKIDYYLAGGTLVGAVRHSGFLAWDDDADIHMSIENAEKFQRAVEARRDSEDLHRIVFSKSPQNDCMNAHWRYLNLDTTLLMRGLVGSTSPQGQFVDIFVTYPLPVDKNARDKCLEDFEYYLELKAQNNVIDSHRSLEYLEHFRELKKREKIIGKRELLEEFEEQMYNFSQEEAEEWFICSPFPEQRAVPKEWWGEPRYIPFEDTYLPVANKAKKLLSYSYGPSWFEVPSHAERGEHVFVLDFDIPYTEYTKEYNKHLNVQEYYNKEVEKKDYWFEMMQTRNALNPYIRKMQGIRTALEIQEFVEKNNIDLMKWVDEKRKEDIESLFSSYFSLIRTEEFKYWGLYVDLPDKYLYTALYFSMFDGNYNSSRAIINGRRDIDRPMSDDLNRLAELCDAIDELLVALYGDEDYNKAKELCEIWRAKEPQAIHFMRASILLKKDYEIGADINKLLEECDEYLSIYEDDGELLKYKGDLLHMLGEKDKGNHYYRKALDTLKNGFCITQIKRIMAAE